MSGSDDIFELGLDLDGGEAGGVPAAAERFYQENAGDEALALNDGGFLLVDEQILLRGNDVEIADEAAFVAILGNVQSAARGIHGECCDRAPFKNGESCNVVLNFVKGGQNGVAAIRDGHVVTGFRNSTCARRAPPVKILSATFAPRAQKVLETLTSCGMSAAFQPPVPKRNQRRIVRGFRDADLRIGDGHLALSFGDVRAALEKIGGKTRSISGGSAVSSAWRVGNPERVCRRGRRWRLQIVFAAAAKESLACAWFQQGFLLRDIEAGSDAAFVARIDEVQTFPQRFHRAIVSRVRIELAESEIVGRKFGGDNEANVFEIGGGGLIGSLCGFDGAAALAEQVHFVADRKWKSEAFCVTGCKGPWSRWRAAGEALALGGWRHRRWGNCRGLHGGGGARLV